MGEAARGKARRLERRYEYELRQYRQAASVLRRCQDDGEKIDYKGWKAALEYLEKEQFMLDYQLEDTISYANENALFPLMRLSNPPFHHPNHFWTWLSKRCQKNCGFR